MIMEQQRRSSEKCLRKRRLLQWICVYYAWNPGRTLYTNLCNCTYSGWSAHRLEELTNASKIIRPAYKYVGHHTEFETMEERSAEKITDEDVKEEPEKCKKEEKGKKKKHIDTGAWNMEEKQEKSK